MASTDTTNDAVIERTINAPDFQSRCYRRFLVAANSIMAETVAATASAPTAGATSLTFASQPSGVIVGWMVQGRTNPSSIPNNTFVKAVGATVTINNSVTVASGDIFIFSPPDHQSRMQFASALYNSTISPRTLATLVLTNATNQTNCLADPTIAGGNILDNDIDFQINSIFTGIAISRGW